MRQCPLLAWHSTVPYTHRMTEAIAFDTHRFIKNLTASGFTEKQAEALANEQVQLLNSNLATKADTLAIKADIEKLKGDLALKIEKLKVDIEKLRGALELRIENVKSDLELKIENVKSDLELKIENVRVDIEKVKSSLLKWMVMAMIAQGGLIVALLKVLL